MRLEFSDGDYLSISVVSPSISDVTYSQLGAAMKCGNFAGSVEAWFDRGEVEGFIGSLEQLNKALRGEAMLASEDGGRSLVIEVLPSDRLGHSFESQAMASICKQLIEGVTGKGDA